MKRLGVIVITLALVAGMVGCPAEPEPSPPVQYSLTISSSEGGEVTTPGEGVFVYSQGGMVSLVAAPASGYYLEGWAGDVSTIANTRAASTTITMNGDYSITASFQLIPLAKYNLTVTSTEGGSAVAPGEGTFTYDAGTLVELVAEASEGYRFMEWTGNAGSVADVAAASTTVTMVGVYTITARFAKEIRTWHDLDAVRDNLGGSYVLMNDLDSTTVGYAELAGPTANDGKGWQPIGSITVHPVTGIIIEPARPFAGRFAGEGYGINELFVYRPDEDGVGLFGCVDDGGIVENIGLVAAAVTGRSRVGAIVGWNLGTVSQCHFIGCVSGDSTVGGLIGWNFVGTLVSSYAAGSVTGGFDLGGLVGAITWGATVSNSHYNYDELRINGENVITIGALLTEDFEQWLAADRSLDIHGRLSQQDGYYTIGNVSDFKQLLAFGQDPLLRFRLVADLDLSSEPNFYIPYLAGEFDGAGHHISNLSFRFGSISHVGLFGYLASGGKVTRIGVQYVDIVACSSVGGVVGWSDGTLSDSHVTGSVAGRAHVGGMVGAIHLGTVADSYANCGVTGQWGTGGLVGMNYYGTIANSHYNYDEVLINGQKVVTVGALFSVDFKQWLANDKFLDVSERLSQEGGYYAISSLSDLKQLLAFGQDGSLKFRLQDDLDLGNERDFYIPYLAGEFDGNGHRIENLSFSFHFVSNVGLFGYLASGGKITRIGVENVNTTGAEMVGGLTGHNRWGSTVSNSYSTGVVTGGQQIGGLIGWNVGTLHDCWSSASATGNARVGGLIGWGFGAVTRCYSTGRVTGKQWSGGLVGVAGPTVQNCFWDMQTSGQSTSDGGTGKTTAEMKNIATFRTAGWSIVSVAPGATDGTRTWNIVDGQTYPFLSWQPVT